MDIIKEMQLLMIYNLVMIAEKKADLGWRLRSLRGD